MASISISQERAEAILKRIIKLLSFGIKAFESSKVTEKNQLLKILLLNCIYDGEKLQISVKKPFDLFISNGLNQLWQSTVSKFRTAIPLYEAEILDNLDLLEEFLNDLQSQHS